METSKAYDRHCTIGWRNRRYSHMLEDVDLKKKKVFTDPKQVIIARRDLMMPDGKLAAQVGHAVIKVFLDLGSWHPIHPDFPKEEAFSLVPTSDEMKYWMQVSFPKIVLGVDTEEEMEILYCEAQNAGLPCSKIIDTGRTVYGGAHNLTCIAIGPADRPSIDAITGHLPLYKPWDIEKEGVPEWMKSIST